MSFKLVQNENVNSRDTYPQTPSFSYAYLVLLVESDKC